MGLTVRKFEDRDAERVVDIMYESFKSFFKERWDASHRGDPESLKKNAHSETPGRIMTAFVAELDGVVVGYLSIEINTRIGLGTLHSIGVDPRIFARGIGKAMVAEAEKLWRHYRMRKIYTCTSHINSRALAFYKSLGFEEEGLLKSHFMDGIDEIQLGKFYKYD